MPWRQVDLNLGPLDYEPVALTTLPPPLASPVLTKSLEEEQLSECEFASRRGMEGRKKP